MNRRVDQQPDSADDAVFQAYSSCADELPSPDLDKTIIAAAHRKADSVAKKSNKIESGSRFWEKLRIPVSMLGAAAVTMTLAQMMWPFVKTSELTGNGQFSESSEAQQVDIGTFPLARGVQENDQIPPRNKLTNRHEISAKGSEFVSIETLNKLIEPPPLFADTNKTVAADEPSRDQWEEQIVMLAKSGQFNEMNQEISLFAKQYPDYPILAKVRPFVQ